jgi:hypothetical protein
MKAVAYLIQCVLSALAILAAGVLVIAGLLFQRILTRQS